MVDFEINKRLKYLISDVFNVSALSFSSKYNDNGGVKTSQVLRERNGLSMQLLEQIIKAYPEINREWLLTGEGEMLKNEDVVKLPQKRGTIRYWIDIQATASGVMQFEDGDSLQYIDLQIPEFRDCTDAINLYGDSMVPRYKSGQIIILKKWTESYIDYGNVYLIITRGGHRMVKVLKSVIGDDDQVLCVSCNPEYSPFLLCKDEIVNLYIVKGAVEKSTL